MEGRGARGEGAVEPVAPGHAVESDAGHWRGEERGELSAERALGRAEAGKGRGILEKGVRGQGVKGEIPKT